MFKKFKNTLIKFLIYRPIALLMSYLAIIVPSVLAMFYLPVSLMPQIDIPQIKIYITYPQALARELENNITRPLKFNLLHISHIENINTKTQNGQATLELSFKYGTNTDLAYIECNEKVDAAMRFFPKDMPRPIVVKASATDIPVFSINVFQKQNNSTKNFYQLSQFVNTVVKRRLEQMKEVAFVDVTGGTQAQIEIVPDLYVIENLGISLLDIENLLISNNLNFGVINLISGQYSYFVQFENKLKNKSDIENLSLKVGERIFKLKDLSSVNQSIEDRKGLFLHNTQEALNMQIIMQNNAQISKLEKTVDQALKDFTNKYPQIGFEKVQDNSQLLKFSINNLSQSLFYGIILAVLLVYLFLKKIRLALISAISIPTSLLISFLVLYFFNFSINIISLSGLILGVGLMIDNSIIVIDNISNHKLNMPTTKACIIGTNEIIRPMISSVLTTLAVFFPLVLIGGMAGELFGEQAFSIGISLVISLIISLTLIPVLYNILITKDIDFDISQTKTEKLYKTLFYLSFKNKKKVFLFFIFLTFFSSFFFLKIEKKQMPEIKQNSFVLKGNWNTNISINENKKRCIKLAEVTQKYTKIFNAYLGQQQFLFDNEHKQTYNEFLLYFELNKYKDTEKIKKVITDFFEKEFPYANFEFQKTKNTLEYIFPTQKSDIIAEISSINQLNSPNFETFDSVYQSIKRLNLYTNIIEPDLEAYYQISISQEKCLLYNVQLAEVYKKILFLLEHITIGNLKSNDEYLPIVLKSKHQNWNKILAQNSILNLNRQTIPILQLIEISKVTGFKSIYANSFNEFIPIKLNTKNQEILIEQIKKQVQKSSKMSVSFSGSYFLAGELFNEMLWILLISIALLYFILAAQFESLKLPLIILFELPIDISVSVFFLYIFGYSINLMSAIGIIVISGIIINDSILKLDAIKQLQKQGFSLIQAIETGAKKRLNSILMTSLTSIFALLPLFFFSDTGTDLQKPFALVVIVGLIVGTFVSLFFIPILYFWLEKKDK